MQRDRLEDSFGQLELVLSFYQGALTAHLHAERAHDSIDNKGNFSPPTSSQMTRMTEILKEKAHVGSGAHAEQWGKGVRCRKRRGLVPDFKFLSVRHGGKREKQD